MAAILQQTYPTAQQPMENKPTSQEHRFWQVSFWIRYKLIEKITKN